MSFRDFPASDYGNEVLCKLEDGVGVITLNAPSRLNTMSMHMNTGVQLALDLAFDDPEVRVLVLTGAGKAFCAGGDLKTGGASGGFKGTGKLATVAMAQRQLRVGMSTSEQLRNMDKPTIAAVPGAAAGAGMSWACACDLRLASEDAIFRTAFLTAGLSGDYGGTWTLPRIVGPAKARELYLMNRKVKAAEAHRIGLVSEVYPRGEFHAAVMKVAKEMAQASPLALKRIKQNLNDADVELNFGAHLTTEADRHARTAFHPDSQEAGKAFVERRPAKFAPVQRQEPWRAAKL
eukprot:Hpha_TRINITY_DN9602_c0_g1::TRINITY_DN9602_c0_g1_i1::g.184233::m.184233/K15866/paaG; 2-(1,2-epoxy-1,2-dihydrophenyl)acetyl-CoA isomerase